MTYRFKILAPIDVHPQTVKDHLDLMNVKIDAISSPIDDDSRIYFCSTEDEEAYEYITSTGPLAEH
jgi:hypothetical protein